MSAAARFFRRAALLVLALIAFAPAAARAQVRNPTHVACVGDSITFGYGASSQTTKSYPADLQVMFGSGVMVGNFGRNSATLLSTGDLPWTTADQAAEYNAANMFISGAGGSAVVDVIIMLGTNDSKSYNWMTSDGGTHAAQYAIDLGNLVDHFTNLSTHPVVYLALPAAIYTNSFGISESVTHNEIAPIIDDYWARDKFPFEIVPKLASLGIGGVGYQGYGSAGGSMLLNGLIAMELARVDSSIATFWGVHTGLAAGSIYLCGDAEQKHRWLPAMMRFEKIGSFGLTEPLVGSATSGGMMTTCRREGDTWMLNGEKKWIGNATFADINVIWAREETSNQVKGFIVGKDNPGFSVKKI